MSGIERLSRHRESDFGQTTDRNDPLYKGICSRIGWLLSTPLAFSHAERGGGLNICHIGDRNHIYMYIYLKACASLDNTGLNLSACGRRRVVAREERRATGAVAGQGVRGLRKERESKRATGDGPARGERWASDDRARGE